MDSECLAFDVAGQHVVLAPSLPEECALVGFRAGERRVSSVYQGG